MKDKDKSKSNYSNHQISDYDVDNDIDIQQLKKEISEIRSADLSHIFNKTGSMSVLESQNNNNSAHSYNNE